MPLKKQLFIKISGIGFFYVDYVKGTKLLAKKMEFKRQLVFVSELKSAFSCFKGTYGVPCNSCFPMFDVKIVKGGHYTFNKVLPHESHREMQACNLVTEQWSERFMAGY